MNEIKVGDKVKYVGDADKLLNLLPERDELEEYIKDKGTFSITELPKTEDGFYQIEFSPEENTWHTFYVHIDEIARVK